MPGQIVIINGTSGSGKSTTCDLFAKRAQEFWLVYGIDHFLGSTYPRKFGHGGERSKEGIHAHPVDPAEPDGNLRWTISDKGLKAFGVFHEWLAAASQNGCNIILDHLMMTDPPLLQDCIRRLEGLPVLFVNLKPSYDALVARIEQREIGNRFSNSSFDGDQVRQSKERLLRLRPWFYQAVYENTCYDLEIDTVQHTPEQVCEMIENRLAAGEGTAFSELRKRYL